MKKYNPVEIKNMLKRVFTSSDGKEFDKLLQNICGYNYDVFNDDPYRTAYLAGKRAVYLQLKNLLKEDK